MKKISEITRRDIIDLILNGFVEKEIIRIPHSDYQYHEKVEYSIRYFGRLDEITFLKRLYPLDTMPSTDIRHKNAEGDIIQHTIWNDDWPVGWVFQDGRFKLGHGNDDEPLLNFLCEMFHPAVRDEESNWKRFLEKINKLLECDGYEIYGKDHISGRTVYGWREIGEEKVIVRQIEGIKEAFNTDYVCKQPDLMYENIDEAPNLSIGKAKELLETCCKTILDEQGIAYTNEMDLIQLMRKTCDSIGLSPKKINENAKGKNIAARILGNLTNIAQGMAELRNLYGDGHGKHKDFKTLPPRICTSSSWCIGYSSKVYVGYLSRKNKKRLLRYLDIFSPAF